VIYVDVMIWFGRYTWGRNITLDDAVSALEAAVEQEMMAKGTKEDVQMVEPEITTVA
jgi:hypothetical protein